MIRSHSPSWYAAISTNVPDRGRSLNPDSISSLEPSGAHQIAQTRQWHAFFAKSCIMKAESSAEPNFRQVPQMLVMCSEAVTGYESGHPFPPQKCGRSPILFVRPKGNRVNPSISLTATRNLPCIDHQPTLHTKPQPNLCQLPKA